MAKKERTPAQKIASYIGQLKLQWSRSPMKWEAFHRARVGPGLVRCEKCKVETHWKLAEIDHIVPIVEIGGERDPAMEAMRMNCSPSGLMVLCEACHKAKSKSENAQRRKK